MRVSKTRQNEIKKTLKGINELKGYAVKQMLNDMTQSFEKSEEIVVFNQEHCQVVAVSCINGNLKFVFGNGTCINPIAEEYDADNYNLVYCVWDAFFNDSKIE